MGAQDAIEAILAKVNPSSAGFTDRAYQVGSHMSQEVGQEFLDHSNALEAGVKELIGNGDLDAALKLSLRRQAAREIGETATKTGSMASYK